MCMHFIVLIIIMVRFNHYAQGMDGKAVLDLVMLYLNAVRLGFSLKVTCLEV